MTASAGQTCSECGALLVEPSESVPPRCESCRSKSSDGSSPPLTPEKSSATLPVDASPKTLIVGRGDTNHQQPHLAMTVNFLPSAEPIEPTANAKEARVALKVSIGRFRIISILGRGTFGTVYRAYDPLLDREVALKVPRFAPDDHETIERFHREARSAARLHHPNIVTLYENGQSDTGPYLVAEFVDGVPMSQRLREQSVDIRVAVDWVRQIAEALYYAHSEGIVHRDVKPANIMMNRAGRPQIMDFGLAKRGADIDAGITVEGQIVGTPNYMSPEQARGAIAQVGPHSDQYSVGVVLYEILCGRQPFEGDPWSIVSRVANVQEAPPSPRTIKPNLPRDLEVCCLKALEKEPQARYPNLQALADDLNRWLNGLPLVARPLGPLEQLLRWYRHNRTTATLAGVLMLCFFLIAIIGTVAAFRFRELAAIAQREARDAQIARQKEADARLATEQSVIDSYTETGLTADRNGDLRQALLWFANAVAASANHPQRDRDNRIRVQSWLSRLSLPVEAFAVTPSWLKELTYHPSGRWLLRCAQDGQCELLPVSNGARRTIPLSGFITAATFSSDGTRLAAASYQEVCVFGFEVDQSISGDHSPFRTIGDLGVATADRGVIDRWTHSDSVNCLQFSKDGRLLALGGDQSVRVRDLAERTFCSDAIEVGSQVTSLAIAPDGRRCAARGNDERVWILACGEQATCHEPLSVTATDLGGNLPLLWVGNDRLIVIDGPQAVQCWNIDSRKIVWEQPVQGVMCAAVSNDQRWLALGENMEVVLLNLTTGEPHPQRIRHPNLIHNLSFHPRGTELLTACVDHSARRFAVPSGTLLEPPILHSDAVHRCVWSPDGSTFATGHWTGDLIRVWKPSHAQPAALTSATGLDGPFVRVNPRGDRFFASGFDGTRRRTELTICEVHSGRQIGPPLAGAGLISDADFVPNSPHVVLVGGGSRGDAQRPLSEQNLAAPGFIRGVNADTGESVWTDLTTPSQPIAVGCSPDGQTIVVLCHQGHLLLLDSSTGQVRNTHIAFNGLAATYRYVIRDRIRFSDRGDQFAVWGCNALAELRRSDTGERIAGMQHASGFVHDTRFSPDGKLLATCSSDHRVRLWNTRDGAVDGEPLLHGGWVFNAEFSRDGQRLLTASEDKQARIWDLATRQAIVATREHADQVFGVLFLPGEELFLAATRDGEITAWDSRLGKMIAPARRLPGMIYQLSRGLSSHVIACGTLTQIRGFDSQQWIQQPEGALDRRDVQLLGELLSSQRIHEGGAATSLTSSEWFQRWELLRQKHLMMATSTAPRPTAENTPR